MYRYYTTAVNAVGESDPSGEVLFAAIALPVKPAPIRRNAEATRSQLIVEWNVEPDTDMPITGYVVEADLTMNNEFVNIWDGRERPEVTRLNLPSTITGQEYTFRHRAYNFNGASFLSDEVKLIACE